MIEQEKSGVIKIIESMVVGRDLLINTWAHLVKCSTHQHLDKKITSVWKCMTAFTKFYCSFWIVAQNAAQLTSAFKTQCSWEKGKSQQLREEERIPCFHLFCVCAQFLYSLGIFQRPWLQNAGRCVWEAEAPDSSTQKWPSDWFIKKFTTFRVNEILWTRWCYAEEMKDLLQVLRDVGKCATSPRNAGSDTLPSLCIHPTCSSRLQGTLTQPGQGKGTEIIKVRWRR